ncbi:sialin-like [Palaemon carinicauda]|uniref:sialin-like n=1 Tax=Palaemon carinicauda TaxID=392227 RepID=UPI0035B6640A
MELLESCRSRTDVFLRERLGFLPARTALGMIAWFGFINIYMVRVNLSVAIVAMVKRNTSGGGEAACLSPTEEIGEVSPSPLYNSSSKLSFMDEDLNLTTPSSLPGYTNNEEGEFLWDETTQGIIHGSFIYGYALTQIIGGRMAEIYGTKLVYGISILSGGLSALLTPSMARLHYGALIALRLTQGIFQGATWPSMHACISRWIPPIERPRFVAIVYLANTLSPAITLPICGLIIANYGWAAQFYVCGILSLIWAIVWFSFIYDRPEEHPRISKKELDFLQTVLMESGTKKSTSRKVPWKEIAKSPPFWATLMYNVGNAWGISIFFNQLPTYMSNVLGFSIKANGVVSAAPFLCRYIGGIIWSTMGAWLISHKWLTVTGNRRIFGIVGLCGPALMILGVSFSGCNAQLIVILFCLALFFNGAGTTSGFVNHTDISPNFAGTLLGITNTMGSLTAFICPIVNGIIINGQQTIGAWQKVFWICVPIYILGIVFYVSLVSGDVQPWNDVDFATSSASAEKQKTSDNCDIIEKMPLNPSPQNDLSRRLQSEPCYLKEIESSIRNLRILSYGNKLRDEAKAYLSLSP